MCYCYGMTDPVITRIAITGAEWNDLRKLAIDRGLRPSQLLAKIVRDALAANRERGK